MGGKTRGEIMRIKFKYCNHVWSINWHSDYDKCCKCGFVKVKEK